MCSTFTLHDKMGRGVETHCRERGGPEGFRWQTLGWACHQQELSASEGSVLVWATYDSIRSL